MTSGTLESVLASECESELVQQLNSQAGVLRSDCGNIISENAVSENQDGAVQKTEHKKHTQNNVFCEL